MLRFGDYGNFSVWIGATAIVATPTQGAASAHKMESPQDRAVLLHTALIWVGLAEHAAKVADLYPEGNHVGRRAGVANSIAAQSAARNVVGPEKRNVAPLLAYSTAKV
jgi:hypothetical protein